MTDREMAEEYVIKNAKHILDLNNAFCSAHEAFLAGLKAGREQTEKNRTNVKGGINYEI